MKYEVGFVCLCDVGSVIGCTKLKDTEWISRQDPYVCLEYGSTNFRTTTCTGYVLDFPC